MFNESLDIPIVSKCVRHFYEYKEAKLFYIQSIIDGNDAAEITISDTIPGWIVHYYDITPKKKVRTMTVSELITKTGIDNFKLTFKNVLNQIIENPNPNIIGNMKVKATEIDWLSQIAIIMVVSL